MRSKTGSVIFAFILGQIVQYFVMAVSTSFAPRQQLIFCGCLGGIVIVAFLFGTRVTADDVTQRAILPPMPSEEFENEDQIA